MKILDILPAHKENTTQYYTVSYESHYKIFTESMKRRDIIRNFSLSKEEFNRILLDSMRRETDNI